jgi:hypothetical protein
VTALDIKAPPVPLAMNLAGSVEHPTIGSGPYLVDTEGRPYLPVGEGGIVLGVELGDGVFSFAAEHASPGACVVHPDQPARHALTALSCLGNPATVRSGAAEGARGIVLGKSGEAGRVLVWFPTPVRERLVPGDDVAVRAFGQGAQLPPALEGVGGRLMNVDPTILDRLPMSIGEDRVKVGVRGHFGSALVGNGMGRPAHQWSLDVQMDEASAEDLGLAALSVGDFLLVRNLDVRHNAGYRRGWSTVGVLVTTTSPRPGHGAGLMPVLCLPEERIDVTVDPVGHSGVTRELLTDLAEGGRS